MVMEPATAETAKAELCSRIRALHETLSAATIAREISSRNARVAALQKRWDRLRARLDLILDQRGAGMADIPGGASGMLARDYKGKEADVPVTRIDPGTVSMVAELRGHEQQAAEELGQWEDARRGVPVPSTPRRRRTPSPCCSVSARSEFARITLDWL
jgi:hypothetical protein